MLTQTESQSDREGMNTQRGYLVNTSFIQCDLLAPAYLRYLSPISTIASPSSGKKTLAERVHKCENCGYTTDRDVAAAQVVLIRGLAAVGHTVKMLSEGKFVGIPVN